MTEPIEGELVEPGTDLVPSVGLRLPAAAVAAERRAAQRGGTVPRASAEAEALYWEGVPANTQAIYTHQWKRYITWCMERERDPFEPNPPAAVAQIKEWITAQWAMPYGRRGQPYAPDTVRLNLAVISVAYQKRLMVPPTHHPDVHTTMRGYARRWKRSGFTPDIAHALTPAEVLAMVEQCDIERTAWGLRDATLLRLAFDIGRRNSELMGLDWADLRWLTPERLLVTPRFGKTDKDTDEGGDPIAVEADTDWAPQTCPVLLLREWRDLCLARGTELTRGPVFREVRGGALRKTGHSGVITPSRMTRRAFEGMVALRAAQAHVDRDPVTGEARQVVPHSLRAGFATAGDEAGVPVHLLADRGGWARESPVILRYMRSAIKWGDRNPAVTIRRAAGRSRETP